jgi:hypothetical protein
MEWLQHWHGRLKGLKIQLSEEFNVNSCPAIFLFKEIYCTDSIYSAYMDKFKIVTVAILNKYWHYDQVALNNIYI